MEEQNENRQGQENVPAPAEELDDLQKRVRAIPEKKWTILTVVCGALLGALCGALLTVFSAMESIGMYGTIAALLIALLIPRFAERRLRRSIQRGRIALMIGLAIWVGITALIAFAGGTPVFAK